MNKVILLGNLSRDPELRTTQNGKSVCSFGLAVNRRRKVEGQPDVDFFNISAWGQLGENCAKYLAKGRKVCVCGAVEVRNYEDREGNKRTAIDVMADIVEFVGGGQEKQGQAQESGPAETQTGFTQTDEEDPF